MLPTGAQSPRWEEPHLPGAHVLRGTQVPKQHQLGMFQEQQQCVTLPGEVRHKSGEWQWHQAEPPTPQSSGGCL